MKQILLTTIAAVVLVGCGNPEADRALLKATHIENIEAVKQHLAAGADVNAKNDSGWTPLHFAILAIATGGHKETVKLLIDKGAYVNAKSTGGLTPLFIAAEGGGWGEDYKEIVELLLSNGADVNAKADHGMTPLHRAAKWDHKEVVELLIAKGANVNAKVELSGRFKGQTPVDFATFKNSQTELKPQTSSENTAAR